MEYSYDYTSLSFGDIIQIKDTNYDLTVLAITKSDVYSFNIGTTNKYTIHTDKGFFTYSSDVEESQYQPFKLIKKTSNTYDANVELYIDGRFIPHEDRRKSI